MGYLHSSTARRNKFLWKASRLGVLLFSLEALAQSSGAFISRQDRLQLTEFYTNTLRQKLSSELKLSGVEAQDPVVNLSLEFDESRVSADAEQWKRNQESRAGAKMAAQSEAVKQSVAELVEKYKPAQPQLAVPPEAADVDESSGAADKQGSEVTGGTRLGRLNVDISNATISEIITKAQEEIRIANSSNRQQQKGSDSPQTIVMPAQSPVTLSFTIPTLSEPSIEPFTFKAADYIKKITVDITLPAKTPKAFVDSVPTMVATFLEFKLIAPGASTIDWVKVKIAAPVPELPKAVIEKATPKTFLEGIWKPENSFISTVFSVLILSVFLFVAMLLASRSLSKGLQNAMTGLGRDIAALKPADAASSDSDEAVSKDTITGASATESSHRGSFDQAAAGQAITHDMQNIRQQVSAFIADNTFLSAEYLSDMFYDNNGLADFRDLLSFMGYSPLKPALDHLPRSAVEKLEAYIEENRDVPPNMLSGAEIAQRMYGECVSKATLRDDSMKVFDPVRAVLIRYDDAVVAKYIADADTVSIAILLKTLSVERGNRIMKSIPSNVLKSAASLLDKPLESPDQSIAQMITKLAQVAAGIAERSQAQRRLIMRLVKTVTLADEEMVYDLIPQEDWDLKRQIMQVKLFLKDVRFVPAKALSQAFNSLPITKRAEVMIVADEALKSALSGTIGTGNKRAEMLQAEVDQNQRNPKKMSEINARKMATLEVFVSAVRKVVSADKNIVDQIIFAQAKFIGVTPPDGLNLPADLNKAA